MSERETERAFTGSDILLRWVLTWVLVCAPVVARMYLPSEWAVGIGLFCGYELRSVYIAFGAPFQATRDDYALTDKAGS